MPWTCTVWLKGSTWHCLDSMIWGWLRFRLRPLRPCVSGAPSGTCNSRQTWAIQNMRRYFYIYIYIYPWIQIHTYVYSYIHVKNICVYTCVYTYVHTYIQMHIHIYIYTHTYLCVCVCLARAHQKCLVHPEALSASRATRRTKLASRSSRRSQIPSQSPAGFWNPKP